MDHGEPDLTDRIVQGDLEAEEWKELSLNSIMADFIHMDVAVDNESAEADAMATVRVVDGGDAPPSGSSFVSSQSVSSTETADFTLTGLKSHLVQNLTKKPKVPSGAPSFPPSSPASNIPCIPYIGIKVHSR
jgi:PHO85 cyclin-5